MVEIPEPMFQVSVIACQFDLKYEIIAFIIFKLRH